MKNPPPAVFTPYKDMFNDMGPLKKPAKKEEVKQVLSESFEEDGFIIERDQEDDVDEEFKVETVVEDK